MPTELAQLQSLEDEEGNAQADSPDRRRSTRGMLALALVDLANAHGDLSNDANEENQRHTRKKVELLDRALAIQHDLFGEDGPALSATLLNVANAHGALGDHHKRVQLLRRA